MSAKGILNQHFILQTRAFLRVFCLSFLMLISIKIIAHLFIKEAVAETYETSKSNSKFWTIKFVKGKKELQGTQIYALFIDLEKHWKTYWKIPGPTGFKPDIWVDNKKNLSKYEIIWPAPEVFGEEELKFYGFENMLVLPLRVEKTLAEASTSFNLNLQLGFCRDFCITDTFSFSSEGAEVASPKQNRLIEKTLNSIPQILEPAKHYIKCEIEKNDDKLNLKVRFKSHFLKKDLDLKEVIISHDNPNLWFNDKVILYHEKHPFISTTIESSLGQNILFERNKLALTILSATKAFTLKSCPIK